MEEMTRCASRLRLQIGVFAPVAGDARFDAWYQHVAAGFGFWGVVAIDALLRRVLRMIELGLRQEARAQNDVRDDEIAIAVFRHMAIGAAAFVIPDER